MGDLFGTAGEVGTYPIGQAPARRTGRRFRPRPGVMRPGPKPTFGRRDTLAPGFPGASRPGPADHMSISPYHSVTISLRSVGKCWRRAVSEGGSDVRSGISDPAPLPVMERAAARQGVHRGPDRRGAGAALPVQPAAAVPARARRTATGVADEFNALDPRGTASLREGRLLDFERRPDRGRRPTRRVLVALARIHQTAARNLVTEAVLSTSTPGTTNNGSFPSFMAKRFKQPTGRRRRHRYHVPSGIWVAQDIR